MCTAALLGGDKQPKLIDGTKQPNAADVPLGTGLADDARLSILNRRKRIRDALGE